MEDLQLLWNWLSGDGAVWATGVTLFTSVISVIIFIYPKNKVLKIKADNGGIAAGRDITLQTNLSHKPSDNDK